MAPAAVENPDLTFLVYHSGFEAETTEGPYDPDEVKGIDRLIKPHQDAGLQRNQGNLYAEMGSMWRHFMSRPTEAAQRVANGTMRLRPLSSGKPPSALSRPGSR